MNFFSKIFCLMKEMRIGEEKDVWVVIAEEGVCAVIDVDCEECPVFEVECEDCVFRYKCWVNNRVAF